MNFEKTLCITGHRNLQQDKIESVMNDLWREVLRAIADGYRCFLSGWADGADMMFAEIIAEIKQSEKDIIITLEAALPYRGWERRNAELLAKCDKVMVCSEDYSPACFMARNRYLVDNSSCVIAVYDGRGRGGTWNTLQYAKEQGKEVRIIKI